MLQWLSVPKCIYIWVKCSNSNKGIGLCCSHETIVKTSNNILFLEKCITKMGIV